MSFDGYPDFSISLPKGSLPDGTDLTHIKNALNHAFACEVVESITNGDKGIIAKIDPGNLGHSHLWEGLFRELTNRGVVWISLRHEDEFNDQGRFLYSLEPQEDHVEVRYANPKKKMVWNRITQIYEWV